MVAMLTALGLDIEHLLNTVKLGEVSVPSRICIPLTEIVGNRPVRNL